jgi:hypothetical protein
LRHNIASQGAKGDEEGGSVRSLLSRILGRFATSICAKRTWLLLAPFLGVVAGSLLAGDHAAVEAQQYSAYSDPEKPAIAFVLSEQRNAKEFQAEFGLDDEEMAKVLAAVREENETLAREYMESERELEAESKGAVSEYNAAVREAVAKTKSTIEALLPEDRIPRLGEWVDAKFAQEGQEAAESAAVGDVVSTDRSRRLRCKVYATYYNGFTRYEVALPHRGLKFRDRPRKVAIRPVYGGRRDRPPVKEVGPWNTFDNYWHRRTTSEMRDEWRGLPRCVPQAQAAYFSNHNKGKDEFGRTVRNPAGVDLTLAAAKKLGIKSRLQRKGKVRVYMSFPWVKR